MSKVKSCCHLTLDNWRNFSSTYLERSFAYGKAGKMLRDRLVPMFDDPEFDASDDNGNYLYDQKESWGRSAWLADRGSVRKESATFITDRQNCIADLLEHCTEEVKDKLKSNAKWDVLNDSKDLMGIYFILETIVLTRGTGSQSLTSVWSDYNKCKMVCFDVDTKLIVNKTYDRYCMELKSCMQ